MKVGERYVSKIVEELVVEVTDINGDTVKYDFIEAPDEYDADFLNDIGGVETASVFEAAFKPVDEALVERDHLDSKVIEWWEPDIGHQTTWLITRIKGTGHGLLETAGWRGSYFIFAWIDGGVPEADNDEYSLAIATDKLESFFTKLKHSEDVMWEDVEDGRTYQPEDWDLEWE